MRSQFCHGMCTYAQKSMTLPREGEEESALTSEARLGDRLGISCTCKRVFTTSRGFVRVAEVHPAQSADAVCTPNISELLCGSSAGLAPRHLSTCRQKQRDSHVDVVGGVPSLGPATTLEHTPLSHLAIHVPVC